MSGSTPISKAELKRTNMAFLVLTSVFVIARVLIHITKRKNFELSDFFLYFAFALFIAIWSLYWAVMDPLFRVFAVVYGDAPPYDPLAMMKDTATMLTLISAAQFSFYTLLYCVKLSLLTLYYKLLEGLPKVYKYCWWGIVVFCCLSWIGSVLSSVFTCDDIKAKYNQGRCIGTANEEQRVIFSLYFAYALDVITDIGVMVLPIRLTWNLQMEKRQKYGLIALFGSGMICILFATIRLVQLGVEGGRARMPEPKWLLLWTVLEISIAIMIGCCPAFAVYLRRRMNSGNSYGAYARQPSGTNIHMSTMVSSAIRPKNHVWGDDHSSQEELAKEDGRIIVTTVVQHDDGRTTPVKSESRTREP